MAASGSVVLVTGGSGLVGKGIEHVVTNEDGKGAKWVFLSSKDGDLRNLEEVRACFAKHSPTHVIHLAARVGGLFKNMRSKVEMMVENMAINNNVLACCHEFGVKKCVSMSSTCVFPDKTTYPLTEEMHHGGPPHSSNEGYAYAKRMIDVLSRSYNEQYGHQFMTVIPTNIYGPHDNFSIEDGHVLPGLMHKTYLAKAKGEDLMVWGTGKPLRQFIFSWDLARILVWALFDYQGVETIILAPNEEDELSIGDVAGLLCKAAKFPGKLVFDTTKADGQFKKTASNAKLRSLLPDFKFTPMDQALQISWDWFEANYATARK